MTLEVDFVLDDEGSCALATLSKLERDDFVVGCLGPTGRGRLARDIEGVEGPATGPGVAGVCVLEVLVGLVLIVLGPLGNEMEELGALGGGLELIETLELSCVLGSVSGPGVGKSRPKVEGGGVEGTKTEVPDSFVRSTNGDGGRCILLIFPHTDNRNERCLTTSYT